MDRLPAEIWSHILSFVLINDIPSVALTCQKMKQYIDDETFWKLKCKREYGVAALTGWSTEGFKDFYLSFLRKVGQVRGLYSMTRSYYGGLCLAKMEAGRLAMYELEVPPELHKIADPLHSRLLASVELGPVEGRSQLHVCCHVGPIPAHNASLHASSDGSFQVTCVSTNHNLVTAPVVVNPFNQWGGLGNRKLSRLEGLSTIGFRPFLGVPVPPEIGTPPFEPGVFKGTYSAHGLELIYVHFTSTGMIEGLKISGDSNMPASQVSFRASLNEPLHLSLDDQATLFNEMAAHPHNQLDEASEELNVPVSGTPWREVPSQPFTLDCHHDVDRSLIPNRCLHRFKGEGHVAYSDFMQDSWVPVHVVVFDGDTLGSLWLTLNSFSLFKRVTDTAVTDLLC